MSRIHFGYIKTANGQIYPLVAGTLGALEARAVLMGCTLRGENYYQNREDMADDDEDAIEELRTHLEGRSIE